MRQEEEDVRVPWWGLIAILGAVIFGMVMKSFGVTVTYDGTGTMQSHIDTMVPGDTFDGAGYTVSETISLVNSKHAGCTFKNFTITNVQTAFIHGSYWQDRIDGMTFEHITLTKIQQGWTLYGDNNVVQKVYVYGMKGYGSGDMNIVNFYGNDCKLLDSFLDMRNPENPVGHLDWVQFNNNNGVGAGTSTWRLERFEMAGNMGFPYHQTGMIQNLYDAASTVIDPYIHDNVFLCGEGSVNAWTVELRGVTNGRIIDNLVVDVDASGINAFYLQGAMNPGDFQPPVNNVEMTDNLFLNAPLHVYDPIGQAFGNVGQNIVEADYDRATNKLTNPALAGLGPAMIQTGGSVPEPGVTAGMITNPTPPPIPWPTHFSTGVVMWLPDGKKYSLHWHLEE